MLRSGYHDRPTGQSRQTSLSVIYQAAKRVSCTAVSRDHATGISEGQLDRSQKKDEVVGKEVPSPPRRLESGLNSDPSPYIRPKGPPGKGMGVWWRLNQARRSPQEAQPFDPRLPSTGTAGNGGRTGSGCWG